jgi:hypothetical protein
MLFPVKNKDKMLDEMLQDLVDKTGINDISHGAVARSILEVVNERLWGLYEYLNTHAALLMLGSSEGAWIDMIGYMLNCFRLPGESDNNYKYRISQQVFTAAAANETAIRLRCLSVPGVKNIVITKYTRGSGSFSVHVITDEIDTPDAVLAEVRKAVNTYKAEGVRAIVEKPRIVPIDMGVAIFSKDVIFEESLIIAAEEKITEYLDTIGMGGSISIQKLISLILNINKVDQVFLTSMNIDNEAVIVREFHNLEWDQRVYLRDLKISVIE